MPGISIVALDISRKDVNSYYPFAKKSFKEQLVKIEQDIRVVCEQLKEKNSDQWIISWREYGLTNGFHELFQNRYINLEQKAQLKEVMKKITDDYKPKLTIISGTVATKRTVNLQKQPEKDKDLKEAFSNAVESEEELAEDIELAKQMANEDSPVNVVRNTAYVFSKGALTARHDKTALYNETLNFDPNDPKVPVLIRPGKGRSQSPVINEQLAVEICREHALGVLAKTLQQSKSEHKKIPLMQFVLSDSINFSLDQLVSEYGIYIDSYYQTRLITDSKNPVVSLYSYDILSNDAVLSEVKAQTYEEFLTSHIIEQMKKSKLTPLEIESQADVLFNKKDMKEYRKLMLTIYEKRAEFSDTSYVNSILRHLLVTTTGSKAKTQDELYTILDTLSQNKDQQESVKKSKHKGPARNERSKAGKLEHAVSPSVEFKLKLQETINEGTVDEHSSANTKLSGG